MPHAVETHVPLPEPPPLGHPVPKARHAVSVQLPTWRDMCGMVAKEPRVVEVQQIGYPRSYLNKDVVKVHQACVAAVGRAGEACLAFPALDHAVACKKMVVDQAAGAAGRVRVGAADFLLDESSVTTRRGPGAAEAHRFFIVFLPENLLSTAMLFWRLTGVGISSRLAESMHPYLGCIRPASITDSRTSTSVFRELNNSRADHAIRARIANLLKRASISPAQSDLVQPADVSLFPSGMAATYACNKLLGAWRPGAERIVFGFLYELTPKLLQTFDDSRGGFHFYGLGTDAEMDALEVHLINERRAGQRVQSVWCECASNPLLRTSDLERLRRLADTHGFVLVVDETIGGFANVDVMGVADVVLTSLTKSFSGCADVLAGSLVLNPASRFYAGLKKALASVYVNEFFGADALVLELNSRKFLPRTTILNRNATHLVNVLAPIAGSPGSTLTRVYHPSTCWSRANYEARMRAPTPQFTPGFGCLFTLEFESVTAAATFFDALHVHKGPSLGAGVTIANPYVQMVFQHEKEWAAAYGLRETIVRISVGLEDHEALAREFRRALRLADRFKAGRRSEGYLESLV